jgi:hypothetical protein
VHQAIPTAQAVQAVVVQAGEQRAMQAQQTVAVAAVVLMQQVLVRVVQAVKA